MWVEDNVKLHTGDLYQICGIRFDEIYKMRWPSEDLSDDAPDVSFMLLQFISVPYDESSQLELELSFHSTWVKAETHIPSILRARKRSTRKGGCALQHVILRIEPGVVYELHKHFSLLPRSCMEV